MKKILIGLALIASTTSSAHAFGTLADGQYCREFTQNVVVGNHLQSAYGTACLRADGAWEITEPARVRNAPNYILADNEPTYIIQREPVYVTRPVPIYTSLSFNWGRNWGRDSYRYNNRWDNHDNHHGHGRWR